MRAMRERFCLSGIVLWVLPTVWKSEVGLYGGVGGMTVMAILAFTMRQIRDVIAAVGWENASSDKFFRMGWGYDEPPTCAAD